MKQSQGSAKKIVSRAEVKKFCEQYRKENKIIGYTSGTFDLVHPGHVQYLEAARQKCDVLIVGVNSDASVRAYKDPGRPICFEQERSQVVAALGCVDHVFIFDETNNNHNVEELKPTIYFKAGDYQKSELTSGPLVESYGGHVEIIPLAEGFSSSAIIRRIQDSTLEKYVHSIELPTTGRRPAVFLDRDGTLIEHVEYLHEVSKFKILPGVVALKKLKDAGFALVVVTNQPGIGLGYFSKEEFFVITRELLKACSQAGVFLDRIYYCPHSIAENCQCRKPKPLLIEKAVHEMNLDVQHSFFIGDTTSDMKCAKNAGCKGILVASGISGKDGLYETEPDFKADSFSAAVAWILEHSKERPSAFR